jgi:hypothetical protein
MAGVDWSGGDITWTVVADVKETANGTMKCDGEVEEGFEVDE